MDDGNRNIYATLLGQRRRDAVTSLRKVENKNMKLVNWLNHRIFNIRCQKAQITPVSLKIKINVQGNTAENIIKKAQKDLLKVRIKQSIYNIEKLNEEIKKETDILFTLVPMEMEEAVRSHISRMRERYFLKVKDRQVNKFERLRTKKENMEQPRSHVDKTRWVINKSKLDLTENQVKVLERGLNFAIAPNKIPVTEIIAQTETACLKLSDTKSQGLSRPFLFGR